MAMIYMYHVRVVFVNITRNNAEFSNWSTCKYIYTILFDNAYTKS